MDCVDEFVSALEFRRSPLRTWRRARLFRLLDGLSARAAGLRDTSVRDFTARVHGTFGSVDRLPVTIETQSMGPQPICTNPAHR